MGDLKIFTENIEGKALDQIYNLIKQPAFADCKIRIMPDVHAGAGCVIGFTADLGDKVIPNIVGVDIGCGMNVSELGHIDIDFEKLDGVIRKYVPSGKNVCEQETEQANNIISNLCCKDMLKNESHLKRSIGSLGGGNHFIEIDKDDDGMKYLVIHSGSRNLGKQVAEIYQQKAIDNMSHKAEIENETNTIIRELKESGREKEISKAIKEIKKKYAPIKIPKELSYLEGEDRQYYIHDMRMCQEFAVDNRMAIRNVITKQMGWIIRGCFESIHNYIDFNDNIVRKGAISAKYNERLIIPMNMRDGCIIGIGKGNEDWNYSAPHGAGRIMSRSEAKQKVSLNEFENSMRGIFTTSVDLSTIDESPMAYKPMEEIIKYIEPTVDIERIIKPIYNFKASE